jgi:hypothetical protein
MEGPHSLLEMINDFGSERPEGTSQSEKPEMAENEPESKQNYEKSKHYIDSGPVVARLRWAFMRGTSRRLSTVTVTNTPNVNVVNTATNPVPLPERLQLPITPHVRQFNGTRS